MTPRSTRLLFLLSISCEGKQPIAIAGTFLAREGSLLLVGYSCIQKVMYIRPIHELPLVQRMYLSHKHFILHHDDVLVILQSLKSYIRQSQ